MKREEFFFSMLPRAVSIIYSSITEGILDKMRIQVDYEQVYHMNDVVGLLKMAQFASMGEGSSTIYQNMALLMGLKLSNRIFFKYVKMYNDTRGEPTPSRTKPFWSRPSSTPSSSWS